jgi:hypothetical protein
MKLLLTVLVLALLCFEVQPTAAFAASPSLAKRGYQLLAKPGEKIPLGPGHYFTYGFAKTPKLGNVVMRVEIFTRQGVRDTSFTVKGDADMPSMRGAHASGDQAFALSNKGVYLLPVRLVMPGDWEVSFIFLKDGKPVLRGCYLFDI